MSQPIEPETLTTASGGWGVAQVLGIELGKFMPEGAIQLQALAGNHKYEHTRAN